MKRNIRISAARIVIAAVILSMTSSCVYFNTMYNARRLFKKAEELREDSISKGTENRRGLKDRYDEVIFKCSKVIRDHPESSWVDDAIFLMGKSLVRQEEYNKGIRKFQELITNYPESEYVPEAIYWLALANYDKREYNQALVFINRFLDAFPDHEIRYQVIFLAGDINFEMGNNVDALEFYSSAADKASEREVIDEAMLKRAKLHYKFKDWQKAAEGYEKLLKKGIPWQMRYDISIALGDCYSRTGRCDEAKKLFDEILPDVPRVIDQGPVMLGQAEAYQCMDSLSLTIGKYKDITEKFPHSNYSAEAYYKLGLIYHEKLDSLQRAQESFSNVAKESAKSEYAPLALQKSRSIKKLIELQNSSEKGASKEKIAGAKFSVAEIKLTRLDEVESARKNYLAVVDSFPETSYAPAAAYAVAWIYQEKLGDKDKAVEAYRTTILKFPRSHQAGGAVSQLHKLGDHAGAEMMQAYIDSAFADTTGAGQPLDLLQDFPADSTDTGVIDRKPSSINSLETVAEGFKRADSDTAGDVEEADSVRSVRGKKLK
ncbi:MAG: tetratricopeptide repeat protein [Candidatus Krumholzibacteriota bacterium]|nr:tetratricopeptide repeat protein [Candidatus Krumholzibacteriota bacterium]